GLLEDGNTGGLWIGLYAPSGRNSLRFVDGSKPDEGTKTLREYRVTPTERDTREKRCVKLSHRNTWVGIKCTAIHKFICEKPYYELQCPNGWMVSPWSASCIRLERKKKSWDDARGRCHELGADLVKIVNDKMNQLITTYMIEKPRTGYWIGLRSRFDFDGNEFKWLDEQHPAKYTSWGKFRPRTRFPANCAVVHDRAVEKGLWSDANCEAKRRFICEKFQTRYFCPVGWELNPSTRHCFKIFDVKKSRDGAKAHCHLQGGNLGSSLPPRHGYSKESFWIGAAISNGENQQPAVTIELETIRFSVATVEQSLCLRLSEGTVHLEDCDRKYMFVCEKEPDPEPCFEDGNGHWFGRSCRFLCQCAEYVPCNKIHGSCNKGCASDFFGPACQYLKNKPRLLKTGRTTKSGHSKNRECITGISYYIQLIDISAPITWMRFYLKTPALRLDIKIKYYVDPKSPIHLCLHPAVAKVDGSTFDVYCPTAKPIHTVLISGAGIKNVCHVELSAGRNLAFKESASQSSTYKNWHAHQAVSGGYLNIPTDYLTESTHCIHTRKGLGSWWMVTLRADVTVSLFKILNRRDRNYKKEDTESRLKNFKLVALSDNDKTKVFSISEDQWPKNGLMTIVPSRQINFPVRQVKIRAQGRRFTTFCELFIFGEIVCPPNRFGLTCEFSCNCAYNTGCFVHSGGCPAGCALGYSGQNCYTPIGRLEISSPAQLLTETVTNEVVRTVYPLTIKCNAQVVQLRKDTEIVRLQISKGVSTGTGVEIIVDYDVFRGKAEFPNPLNTKRIYKVSGRNKTGSLSGHEARFIGVEWRIFNPRCTDSTIYQCTVTYRVQRGKDSNAIATRSGQQELKVVPEKLQNVHLIVTMQGPEWDGSKYAFLICMVYGHPDVELTWEIGSSNGSSVRWVISPTSKNDVPSENECSVYQHSAVRSKAYDTDSGYHWFWCTAKLNGTESLTVFANISLLGGKAEEKTTTTPDPSATETRYNDSMDIVTDTGSKALGCPEDWTEVIGDVPGHLTQLSCIKLYHDKKSWKDARRICQTAGGDLASLQTDFMQKAVADVLDTDSDHDFWIGLNNIKPEGFWYWLDDPIVNGSTALGRFGHHSSRGYRECGVINSNTAREGTWGLRGCRELTKYICHRSSSEKNQSKSSTACSVPGWFGSGCRYLCHCDGGAEYCNQTTGHCSYGCVQGWFGPGCQYDSIPFSAYAGPEFSLKSLLDKSDTTCLSNLRNLHLMYIMIALEKPIPLTWIRLVRESSDQIKLMYSNSSGAVEPCPHVHAAAVNRMAQDIMCITDDVVHKLHLYGPGVQHLCSLYISGGRNVALKQRAAQSQNFDNQHERDVLPGEWLATHAVDGRMYSRRHPSGFASTCSRTKGREESRWLLRFSEPVDVTRFIVYNIIDPVREDTVSLQKFKLVLLKTAKMEILQGTFGLSTLIASPGNRNAVRGLLLQASDNQTLSLCEVYVFGETSCPSGQYGWSCEHQCNCDGGADCFVHSGGCPAGCASGYGGQDCQTLLVTNPSILTPSDEFKTGEGAPPLDINCKAEAVGLPFNFTEVVGLQISRKLPGSTRLKKFVEYLPYHPLGVTNFTQGEIGRDFFYAFTGALNDSTSQSKTRALAVKWIIEQPACVDSGVYFCNVTYVHSNRLETRSGQQAIRPTRVKATTKQCFDKVIEGDFGTSSHQEQQGAEAEISNVLLKVTPKTLNYEYSEKDLVVFYCTASGPPNLRLLWRWGLVNSEDLQDYTKKEDVTFIHFQKRHDDFGLFLYKSTLTLKMRSEYDGKMFLCEAHHGSLTVKSEHIRVRVFYELIR
ncbi:hypothetical protein RRG08_024677, partial [Elysia crispata]